MKIERVSELNDTYTLTCTGKELSALRDGLRGANHEGIEDDVPTNLSLRQDISKFYGEEPEPY